MYNGGGRRPWALFRVICFCSFLHRGRPRNNGRWHLGRGLRGQRRLCLRRRSCGKSIVCQRFDYSFAEDRVCRWSSLTEFELLPSVMQQRELVQRREARSKLIGCRPPDLNVLGVKGCEGIGGCASHWRRTWLRGRRLLSRACRSPSSHRCNVWYLLDLLDRRNFLQSDQWWSRNIRLRR